MSPGVHPEAMMCHKLIRQIQKEVFAKNNCLIPAQFCNIMANKHELLENGNSIIMTSGPRFNIKMPTYQYRKYHGGVSLKIVLSP